MGSALARHFLVITVQGPDVSELRELHAADLHVKPCYISLACFALADAARRIYLAHCTIEMHLVLRSSACRCTCIHVAG